MSKNSHGEPEPITWAALETAWFRGRVFAGPTEKYDFETAWEQFRAENEKPIRKYRDPGFEHHESYCHLQDGMGGQCTCRDFTVRDRDRHRTQGYSTHRRD